MNVKVERYLLWPEEAFLLDLFQQRKPDNKEKPCRAFGPKN